MRFASMAPDQRETLLRRYAAENGAFSQPTMPTFASGAPAVSQDSVRQAGIEQAASIRNEVPGSYGRDVSQVGAQSVQPVAGGDIKNAANERISGAQSRVDGREKIVADDQKSLSPRVGELLDKSNSRTADVVKRSAVDTAAVVGVDSNDNLPADYRRPNEVRPNSATSDAAKHFTAPDASQAAPAEAPSNKPPVDPLASRASYNVPELDVAPGKPAADYEANVTAAPVVTAAPTYNPQSATPNGGSDASASAASNSSRASSGKVK